MYFPEEFVNQVREENDIVDVISNYVSLKKGGANFKGLCPFHAEKTPSFMVSPSKQIFHCFGCGEGGNVFHFLMKHERMGFPETVRALAERCGRPIPEPRRSPEDRVRRQQQERIYEMNQQAGEYFQARREASEEARSYLTARGVSEESIARFRIGYAPDAWEGLRSHLSARGFSDGEMERAGLILRRKSGSGFYDRFRRRVIFPIVDVYDRVLGFGGRVLDDGSPKYLNSPETPVFDKGSNLYGLNLAYEAIRKQDYAILVEGYMDVITAHQQGIRNVVATLGTALTRAHLRRLRRYTRNLALFFDADEAGLKAAERCFDLCVPEGMTVKVVTLAPGEDPDSFLGKHGREGFSERMAGARPIMDFMMDQIMGQAPPKDLQERVRISERLTPLLALIPNPVEQELYGKKAASLLGIETGTLLAAVRPGLAKNRKKRDPKGLGRGAAARIPRLEAKFIGLMMNHPERIPEIKAQVSLDYFSDPGLRSRVERLFELPEEALTREALPSLMQTEDPDLAGLLARYSFRDTDSLDLQAEVQGYIRSLRLKCLQGRQKMLQQEIQRTEREGRAREVASLVRKKTELFREIASLKEQLASERRKVTE